MRGIPRLCLACFGLCCRGIDNNDMLDNGGPIAEVKVNCTLACCRSQATEERAVSPSSSSSSSSGVGYHQALRIMDQLEQQSQCHFNEGHNTNNDRINKWWRWKELPRQHHHRRRQNSC